MKILLIKSKKKLISGLIFLFIAIIALVNAIGYVFNIKYISVFAAVAEIDNYQIKSTLLMEAMDDVGVCNAEDAAKVWANGLKERSAAMQYSVMTSELKKEYVKQVDENFPNWVTGVSSPWIDGFEIKDTENDEKGICIYNIVFSTKTGAGHWGDYEAEITIIKDGCFSRVSKIKADKELNVYMGFEP